jgi:hypothetical protein
MEDNAKKKDTGDFQSNVGTIQNPFSNKLISKFKLVTLTDKCK